MAHTVTTVDAFSCVRISYYNRSALPFFHLFEYSNYRTARGIFVAFEICVFEQKITLVAINFRPGITLIYFLL
jgi:hypothetical protein